MAEDEQDPASRGLLPPGFPGRVLVFGPAYLDRIWRVSGRMAPPGLPPADHSLTVSRVAPCHRADTALLLCSNRGDALRVRAPDASGRRISVREPHLFGPEDAPAQTTVDLGDRSDALGGMGPGYALALRGHLTTPVSQGDEAERIRSLLSASGLSYNAINVPGCRADTTELLLGDRGEKLAVGRRDASARVNASDLLTGETTGAIIVVCSLPSAVSATVLEHASGCKVLAPSIRYVRQPGFTDAVARADIVALNTREWRAAGRPARALSPGALATVTAGDRGVTVLWHSPEGLKRLHVPALPRDHVADPNRAGEAFACGFLGALADRGTIGPEGRLALDRRTIAEAAWQANLAAWRQINITQVAFAERAEILALRRRHPPPHQ